MADILLTVGVNTGVSLTQFKSDITSLVSQINSNPPKIKVQFDNKSLESMRKQIEMLQSSNSTKTIWTPSGMTAVTSAIKQDTQAKQANANATRQKAEADKAAAKAQQAADKAAAKANTTLLQANTLLTQATANTKKWTKAANSKSAESQAAYKAYAAQTAELQTLINQYNNGSISAEKFAKKAAEIRTSLKSSEAVIKQNGDATQTFASKVANLSQKFATWFGITRIIMTTVQTCKKMVNASIEIESAMAQLKIVTGSTDSQMEAFLTKATGLAKELGKSITDVASSIETFSRLGYNLEDASSLAEYANILSNVAATDVDTATTGLTSIIKGYSMDVSEAEHVTDVLVKVGQEYAISAEELMAAFQRGGAALYASGTDFEKSAALFAATNASLQNAESVGTMWKTISARIRGATTELEEMGEDTEGLADGLSKYREEIMALSGVDIMQDEDTYKDMYDIFVELAGVWDSMKSDEARSRVAEILGGTRQLSGVMSTITNIKDAMGAYEGALDSAGTAMAANNIYMETTAAHIEQMKASFQELSANLFDSALIKGFVDVLRGLLETLNAVVKVFGSIPTAIATAAIAKFFFTVAKAGGHLRSFGDILAGLQLAFPKLASTIASVSTAVAGSGTVAGAASAGFSALATSIGVTTTALGAFLGVAVAIAGIAWLIDATTISFEEAKEEAQESAAAYDETKSELEALNAELETTASRIAELEGKESLSVTEQGELERLQRENEQLERRAFLMERLANSQLQESAADAKNVLTAQRTYTTGDYQNTKGVTTGDIISETESKQSQLNQRTEEYNNLLAEQERLAAQIDSEDSNWKEKYQAEKKYEKNEKKLKDLQELMRVLDGDISENLADINTEYSKFFDADGNVIKGYEDIVERADSVIDAAIESTNDAMDASADAAGASSEQIKHSTKDVSEAIAEVQSLTTEISSVQSLLSSQSTGKSISLSDLNAEELSEYKSALEYVNGTMQLNADKVNEIVRAKAEEQIALNETNKALAQADYLENARQIEEYRQKLRDKNFEEGENATTIQESINSLLSENKTLATTCAQYDLMTSSIQEATSAYQHWINAQNASQSGDMFDSALTAFEKINNTLNETDSADYGRIGNEDYKAAIDFVVPESVDHEDQDAVNKYMKSISEFFTFDKDGKRTGLDIAAFCERAVKEGLMVVDEASDSYKIAGETTMEDFAEGLGLALPLVQAMFGEMEEFGGEFDWSDEAVETFGDLAVKANESAEALRKLEGNENLSITMDVSNFETVEEQLSALDSTISEMDGIKAKANVDSSEVEHANNVIQYCLSQKQLLTQPDVMRVDTSKVEGDIGNAISLLQQFKDAQNNLEIQQKIGADTSDAEAKVNSLASEIQSLSPDIKASLELDSTSVESISSSISNLTAATLEVKAHVDPAAIIGYSPESKTCDVIYNPKTDLLPQSFSDIKRTVNYVADTDNLPKNLPTIRRYVNYIPIGAHSLNGTAHASGTAKAGGDWGTASGGNTLVGELGREIVVDPRTGKWYTVGDAGAEFVNIPSGAIVFNHLQTESLLSQGFVSGRGHSLASGTAMVTGGISKPQTEKSTKTSTSKKKSSKKSSKKNTSDSDDIEVIDWIEIAIERVERAIKRLSTTASSSFKKLSTRLSKTDKEIAKTNEEIALQEQAKQEYLDKAADVNLSSGLKKKVREGTIDINEYSGKTAELIEEYQKWYEKALDCSDAIQELHENVAALYEEEFNLVATDFDNQLSLLEHVSNSFENGMDNLETNGMLASTKYYEALRDNEKEKLKVQEQQLDALILKMSEAMALGKIKEGSEAWYEMQQEINATKEGIQESKNAIDGFNNSIKETEWSHFDYLQERISSITAESDFLIELMSHSDLFSENGTLSDTGQATMGLHAQNYNVYMAQADRYAEEIKKLNQDIENDPHNTKLIARREELLELQRESILSAEDEKQALVELAEEGINRELESMQELTESYKNALDEAKDLYDYQKRIKDKTSEVSKLRKQLSAYENDDSEETKAIKQRLEVSLKDAEESLEEAQYERYISDQKQLIDNLYSEYELILNERLDNVDALLNDIITATNNNAGTIKETLETQVSSVGATLSESMNAIWSKDGGATSVVSSYGSAFSSQLTSVNTVLNSIAEKIGASIEESDEEAEDVIEETTPKTDPIPVETPKEPKKPKEPKTPKEPEKKITKGGKINAKGAKIYEYKGDKTGARQYFRKDPIYKVLKIDGSWVQVRHHKLKSGVTGWFKKGDVKAYKTGGLVDYTGLAWVDGQKKKPEAFLSAEDTKMFMSLRDALKGVVDGSVSIPNVFADDHLGFGMGDIVDKMSKHYDLQQDRSGDSFFEINIPIDHVSDYNDFMNQLRHDDKFEKFIQSMTTDRLVGGSKLAKNKYKW